MSALIMQDSLTPGGDLFMQRQMEILLDVHGKKLMAEMTKMTETLMRLEMEIGSLRKMVHEGGAPKGGHAVVHTAPQLNLNSPGFSQSQYPSYAQPQQYSEQPRGMPQQPAMREDGRPMVDLNKPIDRNGVAPCDVSIDKFFNFGTRR